MGLWMDLFSLDSVILIIVTCNCLPFSSSRLIFRRHISWQVLKIAFRSLQIWKLSRRGYPQDPSTWLVHWTLAIMPPPPPPPLQKTYLRFFKSVNAHSWLVSSDGRALQRCYRSQGIESRQAWILQAFFSPPQPSCVYNCDDLVLVCNNMK